jgi:hypothetical protein
MSVRAIQESASALDGNARAAWGKTMPLELIKTLSDTAETARQELAEYIADTTICIVLLLEPVTEQCREDCLTIADMFTNVAVITSKEPHEIKAVLDNLPGGDHVVYGVGGTAVVSINFSDVVYETFTKAVAAQFGIGVHAVSNAITGATL